MHGSCRVPSHQLPFAQGTQRTPRSLRVMFPFTAGQGLHASALVASAAGEKVPGRTAAQATQLASEGAPSAPEKRPAPQGVHATAATLSW